MKLPMENELIASDILDAIKRSFPELRISKIVINNRGWDNIIAIVNDDVVFRFPKNTSSEKRMKMEIKLIGMLTGFPVRLPEYTFLAETGRFFAGYPFIPGVPLSSSSTLGKGILSDITKILRYMREFPLSKCRLAGLPIHDNISWLTKQEEILGRFEQTLSILTGPGYFSELRKELIEALSGMSKDCLTLCHGDLYRGNVLISGRHDRIIGVIDWGDAFYGDYAFDIAAVALDFPSRHMKEILSKLSPEGDKTALERIFYYSKVEPLYLADNLMRKGHKEEASKVLEEIM
ncbi:MAG: aminoglycoside phosphotransferase family protein [Candidatus Thermoplasmatota archaeon]|nr:aminoglycoside phosphotransferase family protein [Candidatus Thermoplasmatota archaeon]